MNDYDQETGIDNPRPPKLSKSAKKANLRAEPHYDEVNVLVTGFGVSHDLISVPVSHLGFARRKSHN